LSIKEHEGELEEALGQKRNVKVFCQNLSIPFSLLQIEGGGDKRRG
jgi:hypothetical protein